MPAELYPIPAELARWRKLSLLVGAAGIIIGLIGAIFSLRIFFNAWLFAWWFWLGLSLGGLALTMLHHMTGGDWGLAIRRQCEAAAMVMPLMFILFLPLMLGTYWLFPWGNKSWWSNDHVLTHQHIYFNAGWFFIRNVIYFACWCWLTWRLIGEANAFTRTGDFGLVRRMRNVSAGGIVLFFITVTMASIDWLMSRETYFYSTVLGFMVCVGMSMSALAFVVWLLPVTAGSARRAAGRENAETQAEAGMDSSLPAARRPLSAAIPNQQTLVDLGNLLLTHVILWAYMSFAQLLIVWMGNVKVEAGWYVHRGIGENANPWRWVGLFLALAGFLIPFLLLLQRHYIKRHLLVLAGTALGMLIVRVVDVLWLIAPSTPPYTGTGHVVWLAVPLVIGIGGIWFWVFLFMLERRPVIVPVEDTALEEANNPTMGSQTGDQESAPDVG
jgi:hypothetical protein